MSTRNFSPVRTLVRELIPVVGSFAPNGTGTVALTSRKGLGWSVVRTSAGLFSVTFTDKYNDLVSVSASVQHPTAIDLKVQVGTWTSATKVLQLRTVTIGTVADVTADTNARVNFVAWFRNSAASPTAGA
jgi:hypothetical protein